MTSPESKRSPVKDKPLPSAGASLTQRAFDRFVRELSPALWFLLLVGVAVGMIAGYIFRFGFPWVHYGSLILPLSAFLYCVVRVRRYESEMDAMMMGRDGERLVAEKLDFLREHGFRIFHDIPSYHASGSNIDHLAIGPGGIFIIETKMRSKPSARNAEVVYDGTTLLVDGYEDSETIPQTRAVTHEFESWLARITQLPVGENIRPVVVFPGWYINETNRPKPYREWVLNLNSMIKWITAERPRLSPQDIAAYSEHVEQRIRAKLEQQ